MSASLANHNNVFSGSVRPSFLTFAAAIRCSSVTLPSRSMLSSTNFRICAEVTVGVSTRSPSKSARETYLPVKARIRRRSAFTTDLKYFRSALVGGVVGKRQQYLRMLMGTSTRASRFAREYRITLPMTCSSSAWLFCGSRRCSARLSAVRSNPSPPTRQINNTATAPAL